MLLGLIFSISLLIAAGLAVYDNPQVREWIDESRRKIAIALHSIGDDVHPRPSHSRNSSNDASTREDDSIEAAERRRRARDEIMERGRVIEERRRAKAAQAGRSSSFDDIVDQDGKLRQKEEARSSAAETTATSQEDTLRRRNTEATGAILGATVADPFADELAVDFSDEKAAVVEQQSRESTVTLPAPSPSPLNINTAPSSTHPSELLVDLTPTTSTFPFSLHDDAQSNSAHTLPPEESQPQQQSQTDFRSVHEWAEASTASFYSPPESESDFRDIAEGAPSVAPSSAAASIIGEADMMSEADGMSVSEGDGDMVSTPGSWSEIGSVASDDM